MDIKVGVKETRSISLQFSHVKRAVSMKLKLIIHIIPFCLGQSVDLLCILFFAMIQRIEKERYFMFLVAVYGSVCQPK